MVIRKGFHIIKGGFKMKITFIMLAVILVVAFATMAPVPRSAIQFAGLVLKKLDPIDPPSYPDDFC